MERGRSKDPGKQERLDNYKAQFKTERRNGLDTMRARSFILWGSTRLWILLMRLRQYTASSVSVL